MQDGNPSSGLVKGLKEDCNPPLELSLGDRLLVHFSRSFLVPEVVESVKEMIRGHIDWKAFLEEAKRHRILGFINYHSLTHNLQLPSGVMDLIVRDAKANRDQAKVLFREIARISQAFADIGAPVVLLKGPALIHQVYRSPSIRAFGDIDILTPSSYVQEIEKYLRGQGWVHGFRDISSNELIHPSLDELEVFNVDHRCPLWKEEIAIDVHSADLRPGKVDFDSLIKNSRTLDEIGPGLRVPSLSDLVIHSAFHFYRHYALERRPLRKVRLKYLADIYACLRAYLSGFGNWPLLLKRASDICAKEILIYGLFYVNVVYGNGTIPKEIMEDLLSQDGIMVPIYHKDPIPVDSIERLLRSEIRTTTSTIRPALWMFHLDDVAERLIKELRDWEAQGGEMLVARCLEVDSSSLVDDDPNDCMWKLSEEISIDEEVIDQRKFFRTHVKCGIWPSQGGARACFRLLWNEQNLFLRLNVFANVIHYMLLGDMKIMSRSRGEGVMIYISHDMGGTTTINKIGLGIRQGGVIVPLASPISQEIRCPEVARCREVKPEDLRVSVLPSSNSYSLDISIPWSAIEVVPSPGLHLGLEIEVNNDAPVRSSSNTYLRTRIAWAGGPFSTDDYPEFYGTLVLA